MFNNKTNKKGVEVTEDEYFFGCWWVSIGGKSTAISNRIENTKKINEFIDSVSDEFPEFFKEKEIERTENELKLQYGKMQKAKTIQLELKKYKTFIDLGIDFSDEVKKEEDNYKKIYLKLADIKMNKVNTNNVFDREIVERCRNISVSELVKNVAGIEPSGNFSGRIKFTCPFHKEKTPSFIVYPENSWYCFGCQAKGNNAIDFITQYRQCSFLDAIKFLDGR